MRFTPHIARIKIPLTLPMSWWALCLFELADN
jgi:hypothetical protein